MSSRVEPVAPELELPAQDLSRGEMASSLLKSHMAGIDVLRGLAILVVIIFHGMKYSAPDLKWGFALPDQLYQLTGWGWLGVNLFFILSGFLITGILDDTLHQKNYYGRFYIRRALRILPIYLCILALAWATRSITGNYVVVCIFFLANMPGLFLHHGYRPYGPLWSLAVEEQFYLLWPALYRALKRRGMFFVSVALVVICPVLRALAFAGILHTGDPLSKTWMTADNLAIGAILAILVRSNKVTLKTFVALGWMQFAGGTLGLSVLFALHRMTRPDPLCNSIGLSCFMLVFNSLVILMLCLFRARRLPRVLQFFVFFGDISYGLYLIHMLMLQYYDRLMGQRFESNPRQLLLRFAVANAVAIGLATLSRKYFESPILRLKSRIASAR
jgi:peptidoglycan/LPS O-acetylase OafA/YrhL